MSASSEHSQAHATFVVERRYPTPIDQVWRAVSDNGARDQWFGGVAAFLTANKSHDFRVGGQGTEDGQWHGGPRSKFVSTYTYTDIVERQRIVFTYDMWIDGQHLSTSLTTIALESDGEATLMTYTEQGAHFDGLDSVERREEGTQGLLDQLGSFLATAPAPTMESSSRKSSHRPSPADPGLRMTAQAVIAVIG